MRGRRRTDDRIREKPLERRLGELETHQAVTDGDPAVGRALPVLDDTHDRAGEVDGFGGHHSGMLRGLPAEERAPGQTARSGDRRDDRQVAVLVEGAHGQVVDESDRPRADRRQVVDTHGHEVGADTVPAPGEPCQFELGPDSVDRHHQNRPLVPVRDLDARLRSHRTRRSRWRPRCGDHRRDVGHVAVGAVEVDPRLPI